MHSEKIVCMWVVFLAFEQNTNSKLWEAVLVTLSPG